MSVPFEPKYTRFPFIVLSYEDKEKRVPMELIINYETKELFVSSPDNSELIPLNNIDLLNHLVDYNNPHKVTKNDVGLGNVLNVEQATRMEFLEHITDYYNPHRVTKEQVGLGNVINTLPAPLFDQLLLKKKYEKLMKSYNELLETIKSTPRFKLNYVVKPENENGVIVRTFYNNQWNYGEDHMLPDGEYYFEAYYDKEEALKIENPVEIVVYPSEAKVEMYYNGTWNTGKKHSLPEGNYAVRCTMLGYEDFIDKFEVRKNMQPITIRMISNKQNVVFATNPINAVVEVRYDGRWNEGNRHNLPVGEYLYRVYADGFKAIDGSFVIEDEDVIIPITLSKNTFPITFECIGHPDAKIYVYDVDKKEWITSEDNVFELKDGVKYKYKAIKSGYKTIERQYAPHGSPDLVRIDLTIQRYNVTISTNPPGAELSLLDEDKTIVGLNGVINVDVIEGKEYKVYASLPGYNKIDWEPITFTESGNRIIELVETPHRIIFNDIEPTAIKYELVSVGNDDLPEPLVVQDNRIYYVGIYKFRFSAIGYGTLYKSISVTLDSPETMVYDISLVKQFSLDVLVLDKDSKLRITDHSILITSVADTNVSYTMSTGYIPEGEYNIKIVKSGYVMYNEKHTLSNSTPGSIRIELERVKYDINIITDPADAKVAISGAMIYGTPITEKNIKLPSGRYRIVVSKDKYGEMDSFFEVKDRPDTFNYVLEHQGYQINLSTNVNAPNLQWSIQHPDDKLTTTPVFRSKTKGRYIVTVIDPTDVYRMETKPFEFTITDDDFTGVINMIAINKFNVILKTIPAEATGYIDGTIGKFKKLPKGKYKAHAMYDGYEPKEIEFNVVDKDIRPEIVLDKRGIRVNFNLKPTDTTITIAKKGGNINIPLSKTSSRYHTYLSNDTFIVYGRHESYPTKSKEFIITGTETTIDLDLTGTTPPSPQPEGNVKLNGIPDDAIVNVEVLSLTDNARFNGLPEDAIVEFVKL